jgi:MFS family permease
MVQDNPNRDRRLILGAALFRSIGVGMAGVLLGVYLPTAGLSGTRLGVVVAAGIAGNIVALVPLTLVGDRPGRRRILVALALVAAAGGVAFAATTSFTSLVVFGFAGMMNGMGRDRGPAFALEQGLLPAVVPERRRTWVLAQYNLVLDAGHAIGALAGAVPVVLRWWLHAELLASYRMAFGLYAALNVLAAVLYLGLSPAIERESGVAALERRAAGVQARGSARLSPRSRRVVTRLSALLSLDALGGGFLGGALVGYWFFRRYGLAEGTLAPLFFASRLLNALSHLGAAALAGRIGLVNTMVFTHIPSSIALMAVPLAPSLPWAIGLFLARESLVEMDVPTRQSYVAAVVAPNERARASAITNLWRNTAWAAGPTLAGYSMQHVALATPLFIGGAIKIVYDVLLYAGFRRLKPPEELEN